MQYELNEYISYKNWVYQQTKNTMFFYLFKSAPI